MLLNCLFRTCNYNILNKGPGKTMHKYWLLHSLHSVLGTYYLHMVVTLSNKSYISFWPQMISPSYSFLVFFLFNPKCVLLPQPSPGFYESNKPKSTLPKYAFIWVSHFLTKLFLLEGCSVCSLNIQFLAILVEFYLLIQTMRLILTVANSRDNC